jgi:hypothetical protein
MDSAGRGVRSMSTVYAQVAGEGINCAILRTLSLGGARQHLSG